MNKLGNELGEINLVRASKKKNTIFTLSMASTVTIKDVSKEGIDSIMFF